MKLVVASLFTLSFCANAMTLQQQQNIAQRWHKYVTDEKQYGVPDIWKSSLIGDCEDYALWMKERVGGKILKVRTVQGVPHVVLDVDGMIVDSMSKKVYPTSKMTHKVVMYYTDEQVQMFLDAAKNEISRLQALLH